MEELIKYLIPFAAIVSAAMEGIKRWGKIPEKHYTLTAVILSAIMAVVTTLSMGWNWGVLLGSAIIIAFEQAGMDWLVFKPLLKLLFGKK